MKIHSIKISNETLKNMFLQGNTFNYKVIKDGLSNDAELIGIGRISGTNTYELLFKADSGVEVSEGDSIQYLNPIFEKIQDDK